MVYFEIESLLDYSLSRATYTLTLSLDHLYPSVKDFYKLSLNPIRISRIICCFYSGTIERYWFVNLLLSNYSI